MINVNIVLLIEVFLKTESELLTIFQLLDNRNLLFNSLFLLTTPEVMWLQTFKSTGSILPTRMVVGWNLGWDRTISIDSFNFLYSNYRQTPVLCGILMKISICIQVNMIKHNSRYKYDPTHNNNVPAQLSTRYQVFFSQCSIINKVTWGSY